MPNHFHLVVETPQPNLVAEMKWLLGTYTSRFNRRHNLFGHLFSGRYKSLIVDGSGSGYLKSEKGVSSEWQLDSDQCFWGVLR
jgi:REP element-mobilizing transposase RayT